ncbi:hypothetical protein [Paenibacillus sp. SI8]|uniref:hypothetical protein n=1 Tax=unclassified Paenibacillus TaxID=185978 RepID=UPI0034675250
MKIWLLMALALSIAATGCSKKEGTTTTSPSPTVTVQPSPGAPTATAGTSGTTGGGGAATTAPSPGATNTPTNNTPPPGITKEQVDQISMSSTYDDLVKLTGSKGKLVKEENGKKSYEFAISNQPGYYLAVVYFSDGKISEKNVYQK